MLKSLNSLFSCVFCISVSLHLFSNSTKKPQYVDLTRYISLDRSSTPSIDSICVINLDKRKDRLDRATKLFEEAKLTFTRFPAVNGWKFKSGY